MTLWAARNDVIDQMNERLDVLCTSQFLDDLLLSNLVDVPTVYTFHKASDVSPAAWLRDRFSQTDLLLANSPDTAQKLTETFGYDFEGVIAPGIDPEEFRPGIEPAFESDDPAILFVGRLVESKGIDDLLEAVAALDGRQELHFVGRGERTRIQNRAAALGLTTMSSATARFPTLTSRRTTPGPTCSVSQATRRVSGWRTWKRWPVASRSSRPISRGLGPTCPTGKTVCWPASAIPGSRGQADDARGIPVAPVAPRCAGSRRRTRVSLDRPG